MKCETCQNWHKQIDPNNITAPGVGQCRAQPPQLLLMPFRDGVQITPYYPLLSAATDACALHTPRIALNVRNGDLSVIPKG